MIIHDLTHLEVTTEEVAGSGTILPGGCFPPIHIPNPCVVIPRPVCPAPKPICPPMQLPPCPPPAPIPCIPKPCIPKPGFY